MSPAAEGVPGRRLTVVGSVNLDLVARCPRLPLPGETITGSRFERIPGGKGANQAVAARRLGADTRLIAGVGDDGLAGEALAGLVEAGVDTSGLVTSAGPTGIAAIVVGDDGETQIVVVPGANGRLRPDDVRIEAHDAVLCQLEIPLDTVAAAAQQTQGLFCLNASPAGPLPEPVRARADLIIVNRLEREALGPAPVGLLAVTLGAEGAVLYEDGREIARARPPRVVAVDGTAAGDAFAAAMVVGILEGREGEALLARACTAGALAASRPGAQPSLPTAAEVDAARR